MLSCRNGVIAERETARYPLAQPALPAPPPGVRAAPSALPAPPSGPWQHGTVVEFAMSEGPLESYCRRVEVLPTLIPELCLVRQEVRFRIGIPYFSWLFALPLRHHLNLLLPGRTAPWWAPPGRLDRRAAVVVATLCALSVLAGYLVDLLPETMTYAASQYGIGRATQGIALGVVQASAIAALALLVVADRRGRRGVILASTAGGAVVAAVGALSPSIGFLVASQLVAGALVSAQIVLCGVMAVEEMPPGSRAWALGVMSMSFGLGGGVALALLPLAGAGPGGWRWIFAIGILAAPATFSCARHLPESKRFGQGRLSVEPEPARRPRGALSPEERRRLALLGAGALLFAVFASPAGQFQNEFLRTQRSFSPTRISLLEQLAGTVGGLGTLVGGRLADTHGRRPVAAAGTAVLVATTLASYFSRGPQLWAWTILASVASYGVGPALAVYGGELFSTSVRGRAGGLLTVLSAGGGMVGLVAAGVLSHRFGAVAPALGILAVAPLALIWLIAKYYPETAGRSLESLDEARQKAP